MRAAWLCLFLCGPMVLRAEDSASGLFDLTLEQLMAVEIQVGQRGTPRRLRDAWGPVQVLTAAELERNGYRELGRALQRLLPEFNFPRAAVTDGTDHAPPFSLRGLSPDHALVLVNGKRMSQMALVHLNNSMGRGSSGFDIDSLPTAAVERVEVLRDGAAAQYGSDAIAGILNIVLKSEAERGLVLAGGGNRAGDGELADLAFAWGERGADGRFWHASGEWRQREATNRAGLDTRTLYFPGDPRNTDPARRTFQHGEPESRDLLLALNAARPLGERLEVYGHAGLNERESSNGAFFRPAADNRTVRALHPDGFLPKIAPDIATRHAVLGLRDTGESGWDLSYAYGYSRFDFAVRDSDNASLGLASPTRFDAGGPEFASHALALDGLAADWLGMAGLDLAWGLTARDERYAIHAGEPASWVDGGVPVLDGPRAGARTTAGAQGFPGFRPENEKRVDRREYAAYGELAWEFSEQWQAQLAGRYEHFSDFGASRTGKMALAWLPDDGLSVHASLATGFRAPTLAQSHFEATSTVFIGDRAVEVGTFPVEHPLARELGAEALKPETSRQASLGFVWQPAPDWVVTGDGFAIDIDDRIVLSGELNQDSRLFGTEIVDILRRFDAGGARFFNNVLDTRTRGGDLGLRHPFSAWAGEWEFQAQLHWNDTRVAGINGKPRVLENVGEIRLERQELVRLVDGQPGRSAILSLRYSQGPWEVQARALYSGSYTLGLNTVNRVTTQEFGGEWLGDLELAYHASAWSLALGGHNVGDNYPETLIDVSPTAGRNRSLRYSQHAPYGFDGAFYYLRASLRL